MFCSMCGKQIPDGSRFCPECGAPLDTPVQVQQPAPAPQPEPVQQVQQPVVQPEPAPQPVPQQTAQPSDKKKPNIKLFVILGSAAAVVIAAVLVFFLAIFPEITARHVNMGDYVKVEFDKDNYVNGYIKGTVKLDLDKAYEKLVQSPSVISGYEFKRYFNKSFEYEFNKQSLSDTVKTAVDYASKYISIGELEKRIGVRFDEKPEAKVSVQQAVDENKITVEEPVNLNPFEIIDKCYYTKGLSNRGIGICFESKDVKKDGYTFTVYGFDGSYGSSSGSIYIKKDNDTSASLTFKVNKSTANKDAKVKTTIEFTGDEDNENLIKGTPLIVTKKEKEYTVKPQESLTAKQAKSVLGKVRKKVREYYSSTNYNLSIDGIYLFTAKNKNGSNINMLVTLVSKSSKKYKSKYHVAHIMKNCYINAQAKTADEKFKYETTDYKYDYKSKASLWATIKKLYGKRFSYKLVG